MLSMLLLFMIMFEPVASAQTSDGTVYVATYIDVQLASTDQGIALIKQYREASRIERGNSRVDVVQEIARPNRFVIMKERSIRLTSEPGSELFTTAPSINVCITASRLIHARRQPNVRSYPW